jgi:hypothetical protein
MEDAVRSFLVSFALASLALVACHSDASRAKTPASTDTTQVTSGTWDTPNLGPSQSSDVRVNPLGVDAGPP